MIMDLTDPAIRNNPYPVYAELRKTNPVTRATVPFMGETWLVTRYDDVLCALKHPGLSSDARKVNSAMAQAHTTWWMPRILQSFQNSMVMVDDPDHRRLRNLVHQAFTPRRIEHLSADIDRIVDGLLDQLAGKGTADLLADFALPLPLTVISDMMGVPQKDRHTFHKWSGQFLEVSGGNPAVFLRQLPNAFRLSRFFNRLIALRRSHPGDDLVTALVQAEEAGDRLSQDELVSMIFLLLLAGHETTVNLIGNGMLALLQYPEQLQKLREHPELMDTAIEELLRYGNPVEHGNMRHALEDVEIGGQLIPKGSTILLLLASANRDEQVFDNPEELDIAREPNRHLGFGFGLHYCLGAPLARLEGRIAIQKLIQRFPNLRVATSPDRLEWRNTTAVRGLRSLPIVVN